jgi:Nse1 non-SMC component of SMC5-6 complex
MPKKRRTRSSDEDEEEEPRHRNINVSSSSSQSSPSQHAYSSAWGDTHRLILQGMEARGVLSHREIGSLCKAASNRFSLSSIINVVDFTRQANEKLRPLYMRVDNGRSDGNAREYWALVNLRADEPSKSATGLQPKDLQYFKSAVEALAAAKGGQLTLSALLSLRGDKTLKQADALIGRWTRERWLEAVADDADVYCVGIRSLLELQHLLAEVPALEGAECPICGRPAVRALECGSDECSCRLHHYCHESMNKRMQGSRVAFACPKCRKPFQPTSPSQSSSSSSLRTRVRRTSVGADRTIDKGKEPVSDDNNDDDDGDDNSNDSEHDDSSSPAKRARRQ